MESKKFDGGKPRMELLPGDALTEVAKVLAEGAKKYDDHNWRKGMKHSRLLGAALRHIHVYNDGEDLDPETGLSHLAHASCCLLFLLSYKNKDIGNDDRYASYNSRKYFDSNEEQERIIANHEGFIYQPDMTGQSADDSNSFNYLNTAPFIDIQKGKKYLTRSGNKVTITNFRQIGMPDFTVFYGCDGIQRFVNGRVGTEDSDMDLISEVYEETHSLPKSGAQ